MNTTQAIIGYVVVDLSTCSHVDGSVRSALELGRITARDAVIAYARRLNREGRTTRYTFRALHAE
jgi:hypothetical protein